MTDFDDIRPYNDSEVAAALERVLNTEEFIRALIKLRFPRLAVSFSWLLRPIVKWRLLQMAKKIHTVHDLQVIVARLMDHMINDRVTEMSASGLDKLDPSKPYLFISNHRDIAMDPAFINWTLHQYGFDTVRIAIGDNLLTKPYVTDLIRLNKSFIVKRSATTPREKLKAAKHLSAYIRHSIVEDKSHVWIAQREGRAKDGADLTNAAIISMLALSRDKSADYSQYIHSLNIVPVAISYEWDPCDQHKTKELYALRQHGRYEKSEHEDVSSIALGITGEKGCVHLAFGDVLRGHYDDAEQVAAAIDGQIWDNYVLHPSNLIAYSELMNSSVDYPVGSKVQAFELEKCEEEKKELLRRASELPAEQRGILLRMYANPVVSKQHMALTPSLSQRGRE